MSGVHAKEARLHQAVPMLFIDRRVGSVEFESKLKHFGLPIQVTTLDYADFAFMGRGPKGAPVAVGIERKTISDLLTSMQSGRLSGHQLPGLCESYAYVWLLIEGLFRPEPATGILQTWHGIWKDAGHSRRSMLYRNIEQYFITLETQAAVRIRRSATPDESAHIIANAYRWWCNKEFDDHKSHLALDTLDARDANLMVRPSVVRNVAAQLPGVGWTKSEAVSKRFKTVANMVMATESEWREVPGIGATLAKRIVKELQ